MDVSYNWLNEYVDHDWSPEELAERLTMAGLEVETVRPLGQSLDGVVVGKVTAVREHPNADRLVLCDVDLGDGAPSQIACGAPNVAAGQKVPVATVGTTLSRPDPDDPEARQELTVEARELRGEASNGMICAEDELGLSDDHAGIMVLDDDTPVGTPFPEYLDAHGMPSTDAVLDIELTPNRPDAASHLGVARDVSALANSELRTPTVDTPSPGGPVAEEITVDLRDEAGCPRYVALLVRGVDVTESPLWLRRRLTAIGLQPRNHVVDVTNFVLHECGQPLHAFDLDAIADDTIVVRRTDDETPFTTLDGEERDLPEDTLLICDAEAPVAVAGVMGGANSEVSADTTDVLIESAYFDPSTIRRTAKALDLQTDSSYRFERGVDRDGQVWAAARAAELIAKLGGGTVAPGLVDEHPSPPAEKTIALRPDRLTQVLGTEVPTDEGTRLLGAIGFDVEAGEDALHCTVPTWRPDVSIEEDLIEEVARLHGYDQIPEPERVPVPSRTPEQPPEETLERQARQLLKGLGYREIYTNSMLRTDRAERFNVPPAGSDRAPVVETKNPISEEMAALRPRLLPGALEVMQHNRNHGQEALRVFEFGRVFRRAAEPDDPIVPGYSEHPALLVALSGPHAPTGWDTEPRSADIFDLKGTVETLLDDLRVPDLRLTPRDEDAATVDEAATVTQHHIDVAAGDTPLGTVARVRDDVAADFDLDTPAFVAEFNWAALVDSATAEQHRDYEPVSRFPVVDRDLAVLVPADQPVGPLQRAIREAGAPLLRRVDVFDTYAGEGIDEDTKSVAFTLRFGADRTLTDEEVDARLDAIVERLAENHGARLRQQ
ncbi:phenylalanine--tRNA ligase subunit beta [Salinibacter ruber]|uniref:Phenylalanine--tRNA ligase beta subunit n=1 Tax=Salinibacter ruber TaxID=146919 RepID=A0A9X2ZAB4_9BACT|nr:phenylalanine--tRNA ligase subunit beta [Salinibacter ruber]MCS3610478.1 phenylalanyl-tRNA synthetase beta chain [Salinibacter ruber]MCS3614678.1 phenylalanyl-tRNA synthetase beta chain [Salinibacter ruber]MCS3645588.1 phenylalanyl-tRNA synthetase beta chain [Salinibacter ruber]MCS3673361.1 phenylalanyl-tRNA synthetase beta chain [Salinibacter ruber]MCS3782562.1 phenylalanyl-tRNA synthetase beta chain [Salinibacter ruber]